jgi:hypothetical protein
MTRSRTTEPATTALAAAPRIVGVERHLAGCPRLSERTGPYSKPDPRQCTCDPGRLAAAIRPSSGVQPQV